jgi:hypothetical protein
MRLQEQLSADLKRRDLSRKHKDALRIVIGELQRQKTKEISDAEATKIIRKLVDYEKELKERRDQEYIDILESYLPQAATEEEIVEWIRQNIDFSAYKNKMQAMKDIMAHFASRADGNTVKDILSRHF